MFTPNSIPLPLLVPYPFTLLYPLGDSIFPARLVYLLRVSGCAFFVARTPVCALSGAEEEGTGDNERAREAACAGRSQTAGACRRKGQTAGAGDDEGARGLEGARETASGR